MFHEPYGPRGAEDERGDYWADIAEGEDMLAEDFNALPPTEAEGRRAPDPMKELASLAGFAVQDPYSPAVADNLETAPPADDTAAESAVAGFAEYDADAVDAEDAENAEDDSDVQLYHPGTTTREEPAGGENGMPGSEVETEFPGEF